MNDLQNQNGLKVVDAFDLDDELRTLFRPGEMVTDGAGRQHRLPRYFYEIPSHEMAVEVRLAPHFGLNEFIRVDIKEAPRAQTFPRYIPCAVRVLAFYLERLRDAIGAPLHITVNGGYRSPAHRRSVDASRHMWGTAVDLYRVGPTILNDKESITRYNRIAEELSDDFRVLPYGHEPGSADDHVHLDLGYLTLLPREISEDRMEAPQATPRFVFEERRRNDRRSPQDVVPEDAAGDSSE